MNVDVRPLASISAVEATLPKHYASQEAIIAGLRQLWARQHFNLERLEELHRSVRVGGRYFAVPPEQIVTTDSFAARNDAWIRAATDIGEEAVRGALTKAGLTPRDVDHLFFVTITGIAAPSIDARLVNRLGMRPDIKRTPIFGLGCVAGAAGTARAADYLRGFPGHTAVMLSVELCSLTLQREDLSIPNIIASGLFGDGASAVVLRGAEIQANHGAHGGAKGPQVLATRSVFYPDSERVMGWDIVDTGFKIVLSAKVPEVVKAHVGGDVDAFLASVGLRRSQIRHWVVHTGGPKVLQAFESALELPPDALKRSWDSLEKVGNLSSSSVLFVLHDLLASQQAQPGDYGVLAALGPGFCGELLLLRW